MPDINQILKETMDQAKALHDAISETDDANKETKEILGNILKTGAPAPNNGTQAQAINGDAGLTKPAGGAAVPLPNMGRFSPHDTPVLREKCAFENSALLTEHEYQWSVHIVGWTMAKMAIETGQWFAFANGEEDKKAKEVYLEATMSALKDMYPLFAPSFDEILEAVKNLRVETIDNAGPERDSSAVYAAYLSALPARIADLENTKAELGSKNIAGIDLHSKIIERTVKSVPKYLKSREEHAEVKSSLAERVEVEAKRVYRWQF